MATNTSRLGLLKKDTATDGNDTFNIKTMLNDNWDKIDAKVATTGDIAGFDSALTSHKADEVKHVTATERNTWNSKQDSLPIEQKRSIYISSTAPSNPIDGDIWIEV